MISTSRLAVDPLAMRSCADHPALVFMAPIPASVYPVSPTLAVRRGVDVPCSWGRGSSPQDIKMLTAMTATSLIKSYVTFLPHRALAALAAIADRLRGDSAAALASPPFRPPSLPSATAWGFLAGSMGFSWGCFGSNLGAWPVDSSMIWYASWC